MRQVLEQALGAAIMLAVLADVFLTVLYARIGAGFLSQNLSRLTWLAFRAVARGQQRLGLLTYCGPAIVVLLVGMWTAGLALGAGLIAHPELGTGIRSTSGGTPTDFMTALYVGGTSLSIVGTSHFDPFSGGMKAVFLANSLVGMSVLSLTLTYLMQVYAALRDRNTLALKFQAQSAETGDAAELLARLGPDGQLATGYTVLSELAAGMAGVKESHHFYPILFYFRFHEPHYAVSRFTLVALDAISLIRAGLDDGRAGWLKESAAVQQLWTVSLMLAKTLEGTFLEDSADQHQADADRIERWRGRYSAALSCLAAAGLPLAPDARAGADAYVALRRQWDPLVRALATSMAYPMAQIDPALHAQPKPGCTMGPARRRSA